MCNTKSVNLNDHSVNIEKMEKNMKRWTLISFIIVFLLVCSVIFFSTQSPKGKETEDDYNSKTRYLEAMEHEKQLYSEQANAEHEREITNAVKNIEQDCEVRYFTLEKKLVTVDVKDKKENVTINVELAVIFDTAKKKPIRFLNAFVSETKSNLQFLHGGYNYDVSLDKIRISATGQILDCNGDEIEGMEEADTWSVDVSLSEIN